MKTGNLESRPIEGRQKRTSAYVLVFRRAAGIMKFYQWLAVLYTMLSNDVHVKRPEHCAFRKSRDNYYLEKLRNNI